jgi:glycosyltransferase involved in cell wall biosynthesis
MFNQWTGYGNQRNFAYSQCSGEWILCIDADEAISPMLAEKIKEIINSSNTDEKVFSINFRGILFGKMLKYGMFFKENHIRLFQKNAGKFNDNVVHEQFITKYKIHKLPKKYFILHYSYDTMEDYLERFNKYTTQGAKDYETKGKNSSIFKIIFSPFFTFFKMYFLKLGFLDGVEGFVLSMTSAMYPMIKYFKLRERNKK